MSQIKSKWLRLTILLVFASLTMKFTYAQATNTGTVVGQVEDQSGAVVPGATVTLTESTTGSERTTLTNDSGQYAFISVSPGNYAITVTKTGFSVARVASQTVNVGTQSTANFKLPVGNAQQTVEVQVNGAELQTMNSTIGGDIPSEAIRALPSLLHDVNTFTEMQPGVSPDGSVAGAVVDQSTFLLDGGNNSNDMDGSMQVYTPSYGGDPTGGIAAGNGLRGGAGAGGVPTGVMPTPADSVEEFKVNSAGQTADFNSSAGGQVQIVTKRGTNQWHGSAYEYYLDNKLNANTWDNNNSGTP